MTSGWWRRSSSTRFGSTAAAPSRMRSGRDPPSGPPIAGTRTGPPRPRNWCEAVKIAVPRRVQAPRHPAGLRMAPRPLGGGSAVPWKARAIGTRPRRSCSTSSARRRSCATARAPWTATATCARRVPGRPARSPEGRGDGGARRAGSRRRRGRPRPGRRPLHQPVRRYEAACVRRMEQARKQIGKGRPAVSAPKPAPAPAPVVIPSGRAAGPAARADPAHPGRGRPRGESPVPSGPQGIRPSELRGEGSSRVGPGRRR